MLEKHKKNHEQLLQDRKLPNEYDFRNDTKWIRDDTTWSGPSIPDDLKCRHVEITGPSNNKNMVINALNAPVKTFMCDFEDSCSPTWNNIIQGHVNVKDAVCNSIELKEKRMERFID